MGIIDSNFGYVGHGRRVLNSLDRMLTLEARELAKVNREEKQAEKELTDLFFGEKQQAFDEKVAKLGEKCADRIIANLNLSATKKAYYRLREEFRLKQMGER